MNLYRRYILPFLLLIFCMMTTGLSSCQDDLLYDNSYIGEGEGDLSCAVSFIPLGTGLDTRSAGDAVKSINNLCIVVYKANGEYFGQYYLEDSEYYQKEYGYEYSPTGNDQMPFDAPKNSPYSQAEAKTPRAAFTLKDIPYGRYRIYAVANLGNLSTDITASEKTLKEYQVEWNTNVSLDNAMFGYFTTAEPNGQTSAGFDAPVVIINKKSTDLHSWIKRTVSKVTVAFDPSGLKEAVTIYIRSVTIHDIPKTCPIGEDNAPDSMAELEADGETIYYGDGAQNVSNHEGWMKLQKGSGIQGCKNHAEDDDALYFFENVQGDYSNVTPESERKKYLKVQIPEETGKPINEPDEPWTNDFKDRVRYGSYIEVIGYYVSQNSEKISKGPIKYRFMLGQNTTYNYDARRNYHYKLTLKFRGWANEADWHIVYDEITPTIFVPDPYYISFLYNQSLDYPVRITGGQEYLKDYMLHSHIIENQWIPIGITNNQIANEISGAYNDLDGFAWNKWAADHTYKDANYAGFLTLRQNQQTIVGVNHTYGSEGNTFLKNNYEGREEVTPRYFADYYLDKIGNDLNVCNNAKDGQYDVIDTDDNSLTVKLPMWTRPKELIPASDFTGNNPFYAYKRKAIVRFSLRARNASPPDKDEYDENEVKKNIPFKIKEIKSDGTVGEKEVDHIDVTIYQVPRIVNPKAIWRRYNNTEPFHVRLLQLDGAGSKKFSEFKSEGPWRASILQDPDGLIELSADGQKVTNSSTGDNKYIQGISGTSVDFTYTPRGTTGPTQSRCGIILVEYHDYTCNHLIFVRQGYDAGVELGGSKWSCYNAYAAGSSSTAQPQERTSTDVVVTNSPLSIGSFFKRCNYNYAILESNNDSYGWLQSVTDANLKTAYVNGTSYSERNAKWDDISGYAWTRYDSSSSRYDTSWATDWRAVNKSNAQLRMPTYEDYVNLRDHCQYGYGIVYADGAGEVAEDLATACGYTDYTNSGVESNMGMRACVVYNPDNGDHVIFPIGAIGQGRRARQTFDQTYYQAYNGTQLDNFPDPGNGSLSYGGLRGLLYSGAPKEAIGGGTRSNNDRPLTYNIYREPGAVYWFRQPARKPASSSVTEDNRVASWDINYYTLVFNPYDSGSLGERSYNSNTNTWTNVTSGTSSDALPIKLIYAQ